MIPPLNEHGELPPGVHRATLAELEERFCFTPRRRELFDGLCRALRNLQEAGVRRVYLGGSFVTDEPDPGDVDGCWLFEPELLRFARLTSALQSVDGEEMKAAYGAELYPDRDGSRLSFFRRARSGRPRGVVQIDLQFEQSLARDQPLEGGRQDA